MAKELKNKISTDISLAAEYLLNGELVAIPTETVYGLAANGMDEEAVLRIFKAKERPLFNPLILHTHSIEQALRLFHTPTETIKVLADTFWPGPLTIVAQKAEIVPDLVTAGSPMVAVRIPRHPLTLDLLKAIPFPLAAPSANLFGSISPTTPMHVAEQLGERISMVLDGGPCEVGLESTILMVDNEALTLLRKGGVTPEEIKRVTGQEPAIRTLSDNPEAPGMLKSHYAPSKPLFLGEMDELLKSYKLSEAGLLLFGQGSSYPDAADSRQLSFSGDLHEAARNLFRYLRELDKGPAKVILAQKVPESGIGMAINDRLWRASHV